MNRSVKITILFFIGLSSVLLRYDHTRASNTGQNENFGVIVISHGAPMPVWNQGILKLIESVKSPYPLEPAFLDYDKERSLTNAVKKLEQKGVEEILVIHLSPSSYSNHHTEVEYMLGLRKNSGRCLGEADQPIKSTVKKFVVSPCMDEHPLMIQILTEYAKELSGTPEKESLILAAHGPVEELNNIMWVRQLERIGKEIGKKLNFREIVCMTLRLDSADLIREQAARTLRETAKRLSKEGKVIVVCYVLGAVMVQEDIKQILNRVPSVVISSKGIVQHPLAVKWIEDTINKKLNQPEVPPVNTRWGNLDYIKGKPPGTSHYGLECD